MNNEIAKSLGRDWFLLGETPDPQHDSDFIVCLHNRSWGDSVALMASWRSGFNDAQQEAFDTAEMMDEMRNEASDEQYYKGYCI